MLQTLLWSRMTCSSTFLKYPLAVLVQTPAAYILMYCNAFSTTFTAVRCFQLRPKGIEIGRYLVSELRQNCPAPLFMTRKWARAVVLRGIRTSARGDEWQWCPCLFEGSLKVQFIEKQLTTPGYNSVIFRAELTVLYRANYVWLLLILRSCRLLIGSLSNSVFERRTSTASGLFAALGCGLVETVG